MDIHGSIISDDPSLTSFYQFFSVSCMFVKGMPFHGNPFTKGRLFVHFSVAFPKTLPANAVTAIKAVLPKPTVPMITGEEEECHMTDVDLSQFGNTTSSAINISPNTP